MSNYHQGRQFRGENKVFEYDVTRYLLTGMTITGQSATLTDPDGVSAELVTPPSKTGNVISSMVTSNELTAEGIWKLDVSVELSNNEVHIGRIEITVED